MRQPCVGKQRDVGNRHGRADEPVAAAEQLFHQVERGFPALDPRRLARLLRPPEIEHVETADRDIRLVAVLLPEQQFVDLGLRKGVFRQQRAAARQEPDDGVRLRQAAAVIELDRRHLSHRIAAQRLGRPAFALGDVERGPAIRQAEMIGRDT